jgi:hypothetical protein
MDAEKAVSVSRVSRFLLAASVGPHAGVNPLWCAAATEPRAEVASCMIFSISLITSCPSLAADEDQRFFEFRGGGGSTESYDLSTVQMIRPGRFTIISGHHEYFQIRSARRLMMRAWWISGSYSTLLACFALCELSPGSTNIKPMAWSDEETDEPLIADHRNYHKVEKWSRDRQRVVELLFAGSSLDKAKSIFDRWAKHRPGIRMTIRQRTRVLEE